MFNLLSDALSKTVQPLVTWISVALVAVFFGFFALYIVKKDEKLKPLLRYYGLGLIFYALVIGAFMLGINIWENFDKEYLIVFIPIAVTVILVLASAVAVYILKKNEHPEVKKIIYVLTSVCVLALITTLVMIAVYYSESDDGLSSFKQVMLYLSAIILIAIIGVAVLSSKDNSTLGTKEIARAGICIALSFALSYVKLFSLSKGGSVTLASMLPIMMFSYIYGAKKGVFVGLIYGILQSLQDPWLIHPAQFLLDYPIAFASLGLAGILKDSDLKETFKIALGVIIGGTVRFLAHVFSGIFAFETSLWVSMAYNSFVFVDLLIVIVAGVFLLQNKNFKKLLKP